MSEQEQQKQMAEPEAGGIPAIMTVKEAAAILRVTTRTVQRAISEGQLRAYRLGPTGHVRIKRDDLLNFLTPYEADKEAEGDSDE